MMTLINDDFQYDDGGTTTVVCWSFCTFDIETILQFKSFDIALNLPWSCIWKCQLATFKSLTLIPIQTDIANKTHQLMNKMYPKNDVTS